MELSVVVRYLWAKNGLPRDIKREPHSLKRINQMIARIEKSKSSDILNDGMYTDRTRCVPIVEFCARMKVLPIVLVHTET